MSAKKQPAPKAAEASTEQLCRLFDVTAMRISQLARDGIIYKVERNKFDLWRSVRGYIGFLQKSRYAASGSDEKSGITDAQAVELEGLISQVKAARTYNDARTLKLQIEALRSGYALEVEQSKYCEVAQIDECLAGIAAAIRASIMRLEADLPPMIEGLDAAAAQKVIRQKIDEVMNVLQDEGDKLKNGESAP